MTAKEIHPLSRKISQAVYDKYGIILTVGIYAQNESDPEIKCIRKDLYELVKQFPTIKQIHGFYVDIDLKMITFDIIVDFKDEDADGVRKQLIERMSAMHPNYQYFVILDDDYSD